MRSVSPTWATPAWPSSACRRYRRATSTGSRRASGAPRQGGLREIFHAREEDRHFGGRRRGGRAGGAGRRAAGARGRGGGGGGRAGAGAGGAGSAGGGE